jgi:splicing factor 3A subunit 1
VPRWHRHPLLIAMLTDDCLAVELLDPRWKEQKNKAEARTTATNFVTADAAANLKRLASQRSDIFDSVAGQYISEDEAARRKRAALGHGVNGGAPDGRGGGGGGGGLPPPPPPPSQAPNINIEEQLRAIHEKARRQ